MMASIRPASSMRFFICLITTMAFYAVLSGQFHNTYLMVCGAVMCIAITALARHLELLDEEGVPYEFWLGALVYAPWLFREIVTSNVSLAWLVWSPSLDISPRMVHLEHKLKSSFAIATYINSITLTPGTVTVDVDEDELIVHALTKDAATALLTGSMHDQIKRIEGDR